MNKKSILDIELKGKKVLMRADFNVPLDDNRNITDDTRIKRALPTIERIIKLGGKLILMSHLGRPKGEVVDKLRLNPIAIRLSELLKKEVKKVDDCIGQEVKNVVNSMNNGDVILLENVRFHSEETKNDEGFSKKLAELGDVFVNDAFGTAHRAHSSTVGVANHIPAVSGFLLDKEVDYLSKVLRNPEKPFVLILGGAKISSKIGVIESLMGKVDKILIGGGMVFTFLKAKGISTGNSIIEDDKQVTAFEIIKKAQEKNIEFILPIDILIANEINAKVKTSVVDYNKIPDNMIGVDIGPKTIKLFKREIADAKTIFWNGPMGIFEIPKFAKGTNIVAKMVAKSKAISVIGGGDSVAAVTKAGLEKKITHVSTGGGASLEFMEGKSLPGIDALEDK